MKIMQEHVPQE